MLKISEVSPIIDELEERIEQYSDKTLWKAQSQTDWYSWILSNGPKIVQSWRELAGLISLTPGDQMRELQAKLESIQQLVANQDVMNIAIKMRKVVPPQEEK